MGLFTMIFELIAVVFLIAWIGFIAYVILRRKVPFVEKTYGWAIGIYSGKNPLDLSPVKGCAPALTAKDVKDAKTLFVADPFLVRHANDWWLFFEALRTDNERGEIALAKSKDGFHWRYDRIILSEPFHLSYPFVFLWEGHYYLIPETGALNSVRLYEAVDFPYHWKFVKELISGESFNDSTLFYHESRWWMFTGTKPYADDTLCVYYAEDLKGEWRPHAKNPIIAGDAHRARPAGRMIPHKGKIIRFAQDDLPYYGKGIRMFEISQLTPEEYEENEVPNFSTIATRNRSCWNRKGMHHIDLHTIGDNQWIAAADGFRFRWKFGWKRRLPLKQLFW